jgi:MscS family membrane protein
MLRKVRLWLPEMSAVLLALLILPPALYAQDAAQNETPSDYYFQIETLNPGLAPLPDEPRLDTPQSTLEYLLNTMNADDPQAAAHALNLNALPIEEQAIQAEELARQLHYMLKHKSLLNWDVLPDRPDGQRDAAISNNDPLAGKPRRSIALGYLPLDGREQSIRLNRVRVGENEPVWVFASSTPSMSRQCAGSSTNCCATTKTGTNAASRCCTSPISLTRPSSCGHSVAPPTR